ncbi:MAG: GGDEF domain-containing protein [Pseudomonadales bacterium]
MPHGFPIVPGASAQIEALPADSAADGRSSLLRKALLLLGVPAYAIVCVLMVQQGHWHAALNLYLLLGVWGLGLMLLLLFDPPHARFAGGILTLAKVLWANGGVVVSALFVTHEMRLLLLVLPLAGVLYAALHLSRRQVALVALSTWAAYVLGATLVQGEGGTLAGNELRVALLFSALLLGMLFMASEVTALRRAFQRRSDRLSAALRQLEELAMRDDLTGLYNRRSIMDVLGRQKALADRGNVGFTLCYCDLDHFKRLNDRFGHQRGDQVLRDFARIAEQVVRSVDYVARFGGEEFLLVLVDADAAAAQRVAARLCERTRDLPVAAEAPDYRLSVSVGIAEFHPGEDVETVIQRADRALYEAKRAGRDQIRLS